MVGNVSLTQLLYFRIVLTFFDVAVKSESIAMSSLYLAVLREAC